MCSVKKLFQKILQTLSKNLCWSFFSSSCWPRAWNCVKIESAAQAFSSEFCENSQNSLFQNNCERLLLNGKWCRKKKDSRNQQFLIEVT